MVNFKTLNLITSLMSFVLFVSLLVIPEPIFWLFQVEGNNSAFFISRRAAMLFLGIAVISFLSRSAKNSDTRQAIILGFACSMLGLVLLGLFEFLRGYVGAGIFLAMSAEAFLAVSYFYIWTSSKK
jgi:hypothetical protein